MRLCNKPDIRKITQREMEMSYEYKVLGKTVKLDLDPSVVAVKFQDPSPNSMRNDAVAAAGAGPFARRFEIPGEKLTLVPAGGPGAVPEGVSPSGIAKQAIQSLNKQPEVEHALPVFRVNGNQVVATERVIIGVDDPKIVDDLLNSNGLSKIRQFDDKIVCAVKPGVSPFDVCSAIDGQPGVRFAEPDFVTIGRHIPKRVAPVFPPVLNDPLIKNQYAIQLTRADEAWKEQAGDQKIKIAILDEGVDTSHPDLKSAINGTYDSVDDDDYQEPNTWDGHGTACAGLAAATGSNAVGIRGVGAGCSLMAVRIAYSAHRSGPWITSNEQIAKAIYWSRTEGADVISNSWGGGAPSSSIADEFEKARRFGRGGKGCVIVIAAGNKYEEVQFPGTLDGIITVSASNQYDEIKTPTSKDGEDWWGTCFGPEVDVAAPGVRNLTTDIAGVAGYDGGDYTPNFNGTSSATPIVAGACALVLSADPSLTEAQVREIICRSAAKVGDYPYTGGRNDYFGYGRVDVLAAVRLAKRSLVASNEKEGAAENVV